MNIVEIISDDIILIAYIRYSVNEMSFLDRTFTNFSASSHSIGNDTSPQYSNIANQTISISTPKLRLTKEVVAHAIQFNQSYNAMQGVAKLMNSTPGRECVIPDTTHMIKKTVEGLFLTEYYIKCKNCNTYTASTASTAVCSISSCRRPLNRANSPYFVNFPIRVQLMKSINDHFDRIISYNDYISEPSDMIRDIHDGIEYKKMKEQFPDFFILSLTVNTDGARIFKSSNQSFWPLQLQQNFLPPIIRYIPKNILTAAIHQG